MTHSSTRHEAFEDWLEDGDVPLPHDPDQRALAVDALRLAFDAGWKAHERYTKETRTQ